MASPSKLVSARAAKVAELVGEAARHAPPVPAGWDVVSTGNFDPAALSLPRPAEGINQLQSELTANLRARIQSEKDAWAKRTAAYDEWAATNAGKGSSAAPYPETAEKLDVEPQKPAHTTFRNLVSRWYDNTPGGFDAAVAKSQEALAAHGTPSAYGTWSPFDVDSQIPVILAHEGMSDGQRGNYSRNSGLVSLNANTQELPAASEMGTLEHEATHALTLPPVGLESVPKGNTVPLLRKYRHARGPAWRPAHEVIDNTGLPLDEFRSDDMNLLRPIVGRLEASRRGLPSHDGGIVFFDSDAPMRQAQYLTSRVEVDPRMADIRRRYAHTFGKDVQTVDDARAAWDWWRDAQHAWDEAPRDRPSIQPKDFALYDRLPDEAKQALFRRMTQVPAVMAPIGVGAAASQEQPGILDGLRNR